MKNIELSDWKRKVGSMKYIEETPIRGRVWLRHQHIFESVIKHYAIETENGRRLLPFT
jgi:hypothetical protein